MLSKSIIIYTEYMPYYFYYNCNIMICAPIYMLSEVLLRPDNNLYVYVMRMFYQLKSSTFNSIGSSIFIVFLVLNNMATKILNLGHPVNLWITQDFISCRILIH